MIGPVRIPKSKTRLRVPIDAEEIRAKHLVYRLFEDTKGQSGAWQVLREWSSLQALLRVRAPHLARACMHETGADLWRYRQIMTEAWPHKPYTFRALRKTFDAMWVRCDVCRRYAPLSIGGLQEVDYPSEARAPVTNTFTMGTAERALLRPIWPDALA